MNALFFALLLVPIVEISVLISVGGWLGLPLTIALVLATAILGTFLLRQQGLSLLFSAQQQVSQGQLPAGTMAEGVILAVGGALLLTPGFVTDAIGFLCLFPLSRRWLVTQISRRVQHHSTVFSHTGQSGGTSDVGGVTLEGEYKKDP